jgi:hypothetical protein
VRIAKKTKCQSFKASVAQTERRAHLSVRFEAALKNYTGKNARATEASKMTICIMFIAPLI